MNSQTHGSQGFELNLERESSSQQHCQRTMIKRENNDTQHCQRIMVKRDKEEISQREREHGDIQDRERQHREQYQKSAPHQGNTSTIPIHQPVASRVPGAIHNPGGILANHSDIQSSGPMVVQRFGGPLQPQQDAVFRLQQALPFSVSSSNQGHQLPGAASLSQANQQPILNDALSYLDQVKVQFADQPDVYNRFLDIMKDFKSQVIDTPGVINRVSDLFAGNPSLIQGFNTFLPPGYRIECGTGPDPNIIRVTTPMGTTVQSITGTGRTLPASDITQTTGISSYFEAQRSANWQHNQHSVESPEALFDSQAQATNAIYGQTLSQSSSYDAQAAAAAAHQQQQRGVSQLTSAVGLLGQPSQNSQTPTLAAQSSLNNGVLGTEKRGPVEFNHAISYVNKIKNRFQDRPEIYKQFLEILQTYQRESKPIQDVYAQVTHLFNTAPDLLEDFKQFLPESAAHAKAAAAKAIEEARQSQTPLSNPSRDTKMPPVGNFAVPASTSKESKKRTRNGIAAASSQQQTSQESSFRNGFTTTNSSNKRSKHTHKPNASDAMVISPTLTPIMPEPLPPATTTTGATVEELAFFDKVKKFINNKVQVNEFLKLCNLFSQDLIEKNVLVHKASAFIGQNSDLMNWFKDFVGYDGTDEVIENTPAISSGKVSLSNCRAFGPSYRLLPRREKIKPCSGRDEMCNQVLNDDWASHPTWASEDSGFVAHRKNIYEESLHRIEEERHDYDFNIEANAKVIQLLEPIGQSILSMGPEERENFRMPIGMGGQSQAIYRRVLKKIYQESGPQVCADLFKDPCAVLPIVLARLKQKDEEWRFTQREWEKVWASQTTSLHLKSLDHMGIQVKARDKREYSAKYLVDSLKTKYEEQRRARSTQAIKPKSQFTWEFNETEVILDVLRLTIIYASNASQHNLLERRRIVEFLEKFIPTFFGIPEERVFESTRDIERGISDDEEESIPLELTNGSRSRRQGNSKKADLRRGVLEKSRNGTRNRIQSTEASNGSKESTPDNESVAEEDITDVADDCTSEIAPDRWIAVSGTITSRRDGSSISRNSKSEVNADEPYRRINYKLWCNQTVYVFFCIFQTIYRRLKDLKMSEDEAVDAGFRASLPKPAKEIGLDNRQVTPPPSDGESYYSRAKKLIEDFISGDVEETVYQSWLRHYYLKKGWQVYTILEHLKTISRLSAMCSSNDTKEKTPDIINRFYQNRLSPETTYNTELELRLRASKCIKDGELFMIQWNTRKCEATVSLVYKDDTTFDPHGMGQSQSWQYYVASWQRNEPTEGVPRNSKFWPPRGPKSKEFGKTILQRNLETVGAGSEDEDILKNIIFEENLVVRIEANTYKLEYNKGGADMTIRTDKDYTYNSDGISSSRLRMADAEKKRSDRFHEKFVKNSPWKIGLGQEEVDHINNKYKKWVEDGLLPHNDYITTNKDDVKR
ncbi:Paired amphipathic helix protein pst1 [Golovinomyces cichoracearum]|uniref:Paired amphipathic helix protein pst1 n=1 Tax=Golovinomyces cichoracearum TaxID=62708 RepID=A0A420HTR2_9PEZI|nr:Paired amphipathic helix protein pst1 [Golovinomyces cichoracearum]